MAFKEKYRPQLHFTPEKNWINDPNGLVYYEGEYHLFYQYNPHGNDHRNMHWGHAVSTDLCHWEELGVALAPDGLGTIFSGSAVADINNTSGLFENGSGGLVAIFTHDGENQQQSIAFSEDNGRTWSKYDGNPVIPNTEIRDFRDPKVFWHNDSKKWVMSLACGDHIQFYASENLIDWVYLSSFGEEYPSHEGVWECPDLFCLPVENDNSTQWVLIVSINAGGPNGGSAVYYFTGNFDGQTFHPNEKPEDELNWADTGKDFYAAVTWSNTENTYWVGWMNNWQYAGSVPVSPWRSSMSLVRQLSLYKSDGKYFLKQQPIISDKNEESTLYENIEVSPDAPEKFDIGSTSETQIVLPTHQKYSGWGIDFMTDENEVFRLILNPQQNNYTFYRTAGMKDFSEEFEGRISGTLDGVDIEKVTAINDRSSLELFLNDGLFSMTNLIYPEGNIKFLEVFSEGEILEINTFTCTNLKSIW